MTISTSRLATSISSPTTTTNSRPTVSVTPMATTSWPFSAAPTSGTVLPSSDDNAALSGYIVGGDLRSTNIFPGQALRQDFVAIRATAQITGHLQDDLGQPVIGVNINANAIIGGTEYHTSADTD